MFTQQKYEIQPTWMRPTQMDLTLMYAASHVFVVESFKTN